MFGLKDRIKETFGFGTGQDANKPVTVASVSRDKSNSKDAKGPQKKLEENEYASKDLRYPIDLGTNSFERLHHITFYINVQNKSGYTVTEETNAVNMTEDELRLFLQGGGGETGQANANRFSDKGGQEQLSSGTGVNGTTIAAGGAIFGAGGAVIGAKIGAAFKGLQGAAAGAAVGLVAGAGVGTTIVSNIDLSRKTKRIKSSISLYMPDTVNQQILHEFGEISMTEALGVVGLAGQGLGAVGSSIGDAFGRIVQGQSLKGAGAPGGAALFETAGIAAEASGVFGAGIKDALLFSAGVALNPQIEVLYQKTGHREFLFDFKMIPRNEAEATAIRDIIKELKFYSAPELLSNTSGRYFVPPAEFDIKFFYNGQENRNIHRISTCALVGIDIDYAGAGQWTTFMDGMPVEIKMQLRFKELEIMHKGRIEEGY
jgi:hypothetical protein